MAQTTKKAAKAPTARPDVTSKQGTTSRRTVTRRKPAVDQTAEMSAEVLNAVEDGQRNCDRSFAQVRRHGGRGHSR